jgi:general secretion pathway protein C
MKKYFRIINILLITGAIYFSVKAFYQIMGTQLESPPVSSEEISKGESAAQTETVLPQDHYNSIAERNLFRTKDNIEAPAEETPKEPESKPLEPTKLNLKLWGTVSGDDERRAYAVIEDAKEKKQSLYREGDSVQSAIIKKILREKVILNVNDRDEELLMGDNAPGGAKETPQGQQVGQAPAPEINVAENSQDIKIPRTQITDAISDVSALMQQGKIRPHFSEGKPDGLALTRLRPDSIFTKLGLRNGDIILGVDGEKIQSADDALKFYNSLKSSPNVAIQIKRKGEIKTIDYTIE